MGKKKSKPTPRDAGETWEPDWDTDLEGWHEELFERYKEGGGCVDDPDAYVHFLEHKLACIWDDLCEIMDDQQSAALNVLLVQVRNNIL